METEPQHEPSESAPPPPPPAPEEHAAPAAPVAEAEAPPPPAEPEPMQEVPVLPFVELPSEAPVAPKKALLRRFLDAVPWLPVLTVVVPTGVSAAYYGMIASDVYISESHFVVRSPQRQAPSGLSALLTTGSFSRSQDDTYTVHDFMRSRDAMQRIDAQSPLRQLFGSRAFDFVARFDGLGLDGSTEALFKYYQKVVVVDFDTTTGISMLRVHAFTSEDAASINERLLQMGEALVNELSERGRKDMIQFAESEVARAEEKARQAAAALSSYRNENAVFDPERQGAMQLQGLAKLQDELIATTVQITQVRTLSPDNPQLPALEKRLASIQGAIGAEMAKVAGGQSSLSKKAADFERLSMDRVFAEKQLATALSALEQARAEAQRKQLYLERIAQPSRPDVGLEPRRARSVLATFLVGLLSWGILAMLIAGVREHRD
jgi:capsular polysaccharide transport system permease protein